MALVIGGGLVAVRARRTGMTESAGARSRS
jgi:hypothetical protein